MKHKKFFAAFVLAAVAVLLLCAGCSEPEHIIVFDAEITAVSEDFSEITVLTSDIDKANETIGIILEESSLRILSADGQRLTVQDLQVGQKIRATVRDGVIMEPYDRFMTCYKIELLE